MRITLTKILCFSLILVFINGCANYIVNSEEYKELQKEHAKVERENKIIKNTRNKEDKLIDQLQDTIKQLADKIERVKVGMPIETKKSKSVVNTPAKVESKYRGKQSLVSRDANNNQSVKVNLKNQDFYAYVVEDANDIQLFWKDGKNKRFRNVQNIQDEGAKENKKLLFGMNAGIFNPDRAPTGLFIEEGKELVKINTKKAPGNFYLKPNGVFLIDKQGKPYVLETQEFLAKRKNIPIEYATQSGPMLVINGDIHPVFVEGSNNLNFRNGVGVDRDGRVVFMITGKPVNLYTFASIFRDHFNCDNALYLDGAISKAYIPSLKKYGLDGNFGPLIAVFQDKN